MTPAESSYNQVDTPDANLCNKTYSVIHKGTTEGFHLIYNRVGGK